jgi:hypothetical protein
MRHVPSHISSFLVAALVFLSSLHATQVIGATTLATDDAKKVTHSDTIAKVISDLHHHSDKSGAQLIKDVGDHQLYIDNRSLRASRDKKDSLRNRLLARWQQALHELHLTRHA